MGGTNDRLDAGLVGFGLLSSAEVFKAEIFFEFVKQFPPLIVQVYFNQTAFVVNWDGGAIFDGLGNVVDIDVVTKDGGSVFIGLFNGGAREANKGGVGQGIADVFGEAVAGLFTDDVACFVFDADLFGFEPVLAAVGFISQNDNIGAIANLGINRFVVLGREFLDGGKDDATRINIEQFSHSLAIACLLGSLAQQLAASSKGVEELVVEVVAIGEDDQSGVIQQQDEFAAEEHH